MCKNELKINKNSIYGDNDFTYTFTKKKMILHILSKLFQSFIYLLVKLLAVKIQLLLEKHFNVLSLFKISLSLYILFLFFIFYDKVRLKCVK